MPKDDIEFNVYDLLDPYVIKDFFLEFDAGISDEAFQDVPRIIKYEELSPDKLLCLFIFDGRTWCILQEDYIESLEYVKSEFDKWLGDKYTIELQKPYGPYEFNEHPAVKSSQVYEVKEDNKNFIDYAGHNGYYCIFLAKVKHNNGTIPH